MGARTVAAALTLLGLAFPCASAQAAGPDSTTQPLADGCQRNPEGLLAGTSPEWVYVYREPTPRVVEGVAHATHTAGDDLPRSHDWYDLNSNIAVDPGYEDLLGTANFSGDPSDEEFGRLHVEWETGPTVPTYVWPTEGDRVKLWGSWIWDCGHWGEAPTDPSFWMPGNDPPFATNVPGEHTEFHPMRAMVVTRANAYRPSSTETETDVFISNDGTKAHAEAQCAYEHPPPSPYTYGPDYTACINDASKRIQDVSDRDYTFFVPAPPRPSATATLTWRVVDMIGAGGSEQVTPAADGIDVTVSGPATRYGKSFFVGWSDDPSPPTHLVAQFKELTVVHSLDPNPNRPDQISYPPAEWNLYVDLDGYWKLLNDWAPGMLAATDGETFGLGKKVDFYVPAGHGVRLFVSGRECDLPGIQPCANTNELSDGNDDPGDATAEFPSASAAVGNHVLQPDSGNYRLTYAIRAAK